MGRILIGPTIGFITSLLFSHDSQVLRFLTGPPHMHRQFRILALSATPAADIQGVQSLIANLLISHLELRTESSADVKRFTQTRDLETIVVPLGPELRQFQNLLFSCIRTPLERLRIRGAFLSSAGDLRPERLAKYTVVKAREAWSTSPQASSLSPVDVSAVQCDFGLLICLLHAMELLEQHGLRPLYHYLSGVLTGQRSIPSVRTEMMRLPGVSQLWSDLSTRFGDSFGNTPSTQSPFNGGHPKLEKLRELLSNHFGGKHAADTRVIVFSQFRDSVEEIMLMLKQLRPLVRPACFMGHSSGVIRSPTAPVTSTRPSICASGVSQREQLRVMSAFREGIFNTLVSTCVGEEGLDVGQVDLIVCFDAFKSPIRLAQRLGRTGRKRYGRIVMLLTEGREERNYQFSIARTTSIHKALLEGGAYKRLAFYPHNPRMVPIGLDPQVLLQNLNQTRLENSISCSKDGTSVKCKSSRPSKIKTHVDRAMGSVRFHIEAIGVVNLNLIPLGSGDFHCLTDSVANANLPCLTDLFKVNTSDRLRATREQLQAYKFDGSNANGPATSTLHFMSVLRLCELHRRGLTCLSFHALGLRSVDVETPFSCLVPESDCLSKCTQGTLAPLVDHQDKKPSETVMSVIPGEVSLVPLRPAAVSKTFTFPSVIRGLVSEQFFFNPKVDSASVEEMKNADLHLRSLSRHNNDQIEYHFLEKNWTQYITDMVTEYPPKTRISSQTRSPPTEHIKSLVTPEQWVDSSLLKAITGPSQEKLEIKSCDSLCSSAGVVAENHISSFCLEATESPFSLRFSSTSLPGAGIAARSTPYVKPRNHNLSVLQPTNDLSRSGPSQLKLDEALALLERSTIRLEASTLLDDQPTQTVLHSTALNSAVFGGPPNRLQFDTKLSLGDDFGEGLLFPSQAVGGSGNQPTADPSSQSTQLASSFELPSQIDWSPVMEDAHPPGEGPSPNRNESVPSIFPVVSEELESPVAPLRRRARKVRKDRLLLQTQPGNVDFERKSCGSRCQLLLTQAEQSTNDIDEHDSDTPTLDTYESSFIDDRDVNANSRSSAYLNNSAMLSVYLQTARSPPLGAKGQISLRELLLRRRDTIERPLLLQRQEPRANKRDSPETSNINFDDPHLSSQVSYHALLKFPH